MMMKLFETCSITLVQIVFKFIEYTYIHFVDTTQVSRKTYTAPSTRNVFHAPPIRQQIAHVSVQQSKLGMCPRFEISQAQETPKQRLLFPLQYMQTKKGTGSTSAKLRLSF